MKGVDLRGDSNPDDQLYFTAMATTTIVVTDFAADDHSDNISGATGLPTDNTDTAGRI